MNGILPEGRKNFAGVKWFYNSVYPIQQWWWDWWNMENGGLEVNPSISHWQRQACPRCRSKPWEY